MQLRIVGVAAAFVFAVAIAPTSRLIAQSAPPTASQNAGQKGNITVTTRTPGPLQSITKANPQRLVSHATGKRLRSYGLRTRCKFLIGSRSHISRSRAFSGCARRLHAG